MTTDTLRTALEWALDALEAMDRGDAMDLRLRPSVLRPFIKDARAALATPPAIEERCAWTDGIKSCPFPTSAAFHVGPASCENRLSGVHGESESCHALVPFTPPAPEPSAALVEAREELFLLCPHRQKYGDDGEMQCAGFDFKRRPWPEVREHLFNARLAAALAEGLDERPAGWSATWRDDTTGAGWTRDEAIAAATDLAREHAALERHYRRLRETGLAMFPDEAWLLVEGDTIRLNRTAAEAFSVALAQTPDAADAARTTGERWATVTGPGEATEVARADVDVERLARALGASVMLRAITGRVGGLNGAWYDKVAAEVAAAYQEDPA